MNITDHIHPKIKFYFLQLATLRIEVSLHHPIYFSFTTFFFTHFIFFNKACSAHQTLMLEQEGLCVYD